MPLQSMHWGLLPALLLVAALAVGASGGTPTPVATALEGAVWEATSAAVLEGTVRQTDGRPVTAALVVYTSDEGPVRSTRTDGEGRFRLIRPGSSGAGGTLLVERMGYRTDSRRVEGGEMQVDLVLRPEPLPLPGFQVLVEGPVCPTGDEAAARAVWEAMSRRHPAGLDTMGVASYTLARTDTLQNGTSGSGRAREDGLVPGQRGSAPLLRLSWGRRVLRDGYAFPVRRTDASGSFDSWSYAPLEADFSTHFASEEFGRLTRFQLADAGGDGMVLRFCSRDERKPGLEGRLEIAPDTLLVRAEWRFRTPDPDEEAGGWARFPSHLTAGAPPLLPLESLTWRAIRNGEVQRRAQWYEGWVLAPGDSVPFLPSREWDGVPPWELDR